MSPHEVPDAITAWVERLHAVVDELTEPITSAHEGSLACRAGCAGCCTDGLTVFEIEAALLLKKHPELLREGVPHAEGGCALLDGEGRCRAYEDRPYVCRTQGLPLRWLDHDEDGAPVEARDVCPLNLEGIELAELPAEAMWTLGPIEQRLAAQQSSLDGGEGRRIALRALFSRDGVTTPRRLAVISK
jgi:uncharacterized protein